MADRLGVLERLRNRVTGDHDAVKATNRELANDPPRRLTTEAIEEALR